ncbi:MAG: glycerophosphodiester phosphodiesterase family protein [Pseudomonadota bacterium]|nr:glycerophosphodiester phosphodiesterase family protein [Pseudomonadota bacterium]
MTADQDLIQAHRGASGRFPENTMRAFDEARHAGARSIETDLSLLADGTLAVFHDSTLGRTVAGTTPVNELSSDELRRLDAGSWRDESFAGEAVPFLEDILDWQATHHIGFNLEMKIHGGEQAAAATALASRLARRVPEQTMVSSFDAAFLAAIQERLPALPRALISETVPEDWRDIGDRLALEGFHFNHRVVTADLVAAMHEAGFRVRVYTVNEPDDMARMRHVGVDTVITDNPERWL